MKMIAKLWIGVGVLAVLSPVGLLLPEYFKGGDAWGEWDSDAIGKLAGYIPRGLEKLSSLWSAPIPDYAFKGWEEKGLASLSFAYIISAAAGIAVTVAVALVIGKWLTRKGD